MIYLIIILYTRPKKSPLFANDPWRLIYFYWNEMKPEDFCEEIFKINSHKMKP